MSRPQSPVGSEAARDAADTIVVADVGNTRIKLAVIRSLGIDAAGVRHGLPALHLRQDLLSRSFRQENLEEWLSAAAPGPALVLVASVHDAAAARLEATVASLSATRHRPIRQRRITHEDLPLTLAVGEPGRVGIDRLAAAAAAKALKPARCPAVIVDCGTATTVGVLDAAGTFLGGAILPGPTLMARSLSDGTSRLPDIDRFDWDRVPAMPGTTTEEAIRAGIGLGIRGAVMHLVQASRATLAASVVESGESSTPPVEPVCFLTGGSRSAIRESLPGAVEVPDLVLAGIALAAAHSAA